jgi:Xaa-Pro aminopeptidase
MFLSNKTREARHRLTRQYMTEQNVDVLLVRGSSATRGEGANFRFLADFPNINIPLTLFFFRDENRPSIMLVESPFQTEKAKKYSWAQDVRRSTNFLQSVLGIFEEQGLGQATVGTDGLDKFPLLWFQEIKKSFPGFGLIDFTPVFKKIRMYKTDEEIRLHKKSAVLLDLAFKEGVKYIKPGNTEWEVIAQMDLRLKRHGVEKSFNIISLGPDAVGYPPSGRKIGKKGMVFVELTACYGGYWAQLARVVSLGKPDKTLLNLHRVAVEARDEALRYLRPGFTVSQSMTVMEEAVKKSGMEIKPIYGHISGLDLIEDRPTPKNETQIAPGMVFIVHPCPVSGKSSVLWGETYLITKAGNLRLNKVGDELITL